MFHETHKVIIDSWGVREGKGVDDDGNTHLSMVEAVEAIVASDRFKFVIIDTADMAAKLCLDYHYKKLGVNHASEAGDYGKGWDLCLTQPFRREIGQIMKSGRGVMFITHTSLVTKKVGNTEQSRWETTLPSQVQKFLHTQADVILHGSFGKLRPGMQERDRIISMDGTNEILAGTRIRAIHLPKRYVVDPENPWKQWETFFTDKKATEKAEQEFLKFMGVASKEVAAEPIKPTISDAAEAEAEPPKKAPQRAQRAGQRRK